jgi:hypothetical protein
MTPPKIESNAQQSIAHHLERDPLAGTLPEFLWSPETSLYYFSEVSSTIGQRTETEIRAPDRICDLGVYGTP